MSVKIAIASGKGGTGKTTLSVNLAQLLSDQNNYKKVILADLDVEEPDSGFFIDGKLQFKEIKYRKVPSWNKEDCAFCSQCSTLCNFNAIIRLPEQILIFPELCHACYLCAELCPEKALTMKKIKTGTLCNFKTGRITFIESKLEIGEPSAVSLIRQTKEWLNNNFSNNEIYIFDCPPGNSCPVIEAIENTDFVILVTEPNPFGLHDLKISINTVQKLGLKCGVVINKYGTGNNEVESYCIDNNIPVIGKIKYQREIAESYSKGKLISAQFTDFRNELNRIYKCLTGLISGISKCSYVNN